MPRFGVLSPSFHESSHRYWLCKPSATAPSVAEIVRRHRFRTNIQVGARLDMESTRCDYPSSRAQITENRLNRDCLRFHQDGELPTVGLHCLLSFFSSSSKVPSHDKEHETINPGPTCRLAHYLPAARVTSKAPFEFAVEDRHRLISDWNKGNTLALRVIWRPRVVPPHKPLAFASVHSAIRSLTVQNQTTSQASNPDHQSRQPLTATSHENPAMVASGADSDAPSRAATKRGKKDLLPWKVCATTTTLDLSSSPAAFPSSP